MDALFGLPRKKSAGSSFRSPLYGNLLFLDQCEVDQYVHDYQYPKVLDSVSFFNYLIVIWIQLMLCFIRNAMTLLRGIWFEVLIGTKNWMKQQSLGIAADMNSQESSLTWNMVSGKFIIVDHTNKFICCVHV